MGSRRLGSGVLVMSALASALMVGRAGAATSLDSEAWTVYHGDLAGDGVAAAVTSVETASPAWTSPVLDGQLFGEPLVASGRVFMATEHDTVYAVSASTGAVEWSTHVGTPVPSSSLPCGDITPEVGITGTPVIDQARSELFVVADELVGGRPVHRLVGLNAATGAVELTQGVDPSGADPAALLQRTGLTLDAGQVVFGFGGNYGDCSTYRGRVVAVAESGGAPKVFTVDAGAGQSQGAVWMGGAAPTVDASGDVWVGVGNGSVHSGGDPYDDSDSVLDLSSSLILRQYFAPTDWAEENADDLDLSTAPALLADGQVVAEGKDRVAYLLDGSRLGGIGGQQTSLTSACSDDIDGGSAVVGTTVFLPCLTGPVAVAVTGSPLSLRVLWRGGVGGGPPIVAGAAVWTIGQNGILYGLNPSTGAVEVRASVGAPANHFPTPSAGDGVLLAPAGDRVVAFRATEGAEGRPTTTGGATTAAAPTTGPGTAATTGPGTAATTGPGTAATTSPPTSAAPRAAPAAHDTTRRNVLIGVALAAVLLVAAAGWAIGQRRRS
jgi:outer membrane protein assembly factor BamB